MQTKLRLADAHMAAKNKDAAGQSLRKALEVKPDLIDAQRGIIMLSMDAKKFSDAVAMAKTVQKQRPKEPIGFSQNPTMLFGAPSFEQSSFTVSNALVKNVSIKLKNIF